MAGLRAGWSGSISFGMVVIPVKRYNATGDPNSVGTCWLCPEHPDSGVNLKKVCAVHQHELTSKPLRGFKAGDGYLVITDEDLESLPLATAKAIKIVEFVDAALLPDVYLDGAYYLAADEVGAKAYGILREALRATGKVALGKYGERDKEHFCRLSVSGDLIMLSSLHYPNEVRDGSELEQPVEVAPAELAMGVALVDSMTSTIFDASKYVDEYKAAFVQMIAAKLAGEAPPVAPKPAVPAVDLMAALAASIAQAKEAAA